jgi:hypothetical protein
MIANQRVMWMFFSDTLPPTKKKKYKLKGTQRERLFSVEILVFVELCVVR